MIQICFTESNNEINYEIESHYYTILLGIMKNIAFYLYWLTNTFLYCVLIMVTTVLFGISNKQQNNLNFEYNYPLSH